MNKGDRARQETKQLFSNYAQFEQGLEQLYGSRDKQRVATRQLQQLRQTGPASQYTATFRRFALETGWNDTALVTSYYDGLRDNIKNELARMKRPDNLEELINLVITMDEQLYERQMEMGRTNGYRPYNGYQNSNGYQGNRGYNANTQVPRQPYYGPQPMDLGATRGPLSKKDKDHRIQNNLCLYCGKPGHKARECKAKQRGRGTFAATQERNQYEEDDDGLPQYLKATRITPEVQSITTEDQTEDSDVEILENHGKEEWDCSQHDITPPPSIQNDGSDKSEDKETNYGSIEWTVTPEYKGKYANQEEADHAATTWTQCYNDYCWIHQSDKDGSGWYPRKPRKQRAKEIIKSTKSTF